MKKVLFVISAVLLLAACSKKEEKTDLSSNDSSARQSTVVQESDSAQSSSTVQNTSKSSSTEQEASTSTSESVDIEKREQEQKLEAYNNLDTPLKVLLATTLVDERAETPGLQGYGLGYNFSGPFLFVNINSGAGTGHPIIKLSFDDAFIYPVEGLVRNGPSQIDPYPVPTDPVSKVMLYEKYLNEKEKYDSSIPNVRISENLTEAYFDKLKVMIGQ